MFVNRSGYIPRRFAASLVSAMNVALRSVHRAPKPEGANRRDAPSRFSAIDGVDPLGRGGDLRAKIFTGVGVSWVVVF